MDRNQLIRTAKIRPYRKGSQSKKRFPLRLYPSHEKMVETCLEKGKYGSANEVIEAAIELLCEKFKV